MRGPPRQSSELKLERGNPGKRGVKPQDEPELSAASIAPPNGLPAVAKKEWVRLAAELVNAGVLAIADMELFKQYCLLVAEVDQYMKLCKRVGMENSHKLGYRNYLVKSRAQLTLVASRLGLTPTTRNAVKKIKGKKQTETSRSRFFGQREQGSA
jgi:P27 family predicted phage terminase small subunit